MPYREYAGESTIYAQVPKTIKDRLDDIRAFLGERYERRALIEIIEDYAKRHKVPAIKRKKSGQ